MKPRRELAAIAVLGGLAVVSPVAAPAAVPDSIPTPVVVCMAGVESDRPTKRFEVTGISKRAAGEITVWHVALREPRDGPPSTWEKHAVECSFYKTAPAPFRATWDGVEDRGISDGAIAATEARRGATLGFKDRPPLKATEFKVPSYKN
jgi:hypothetical protein